MKKGFIPQWYIKYSDIVWKAKTKAAVQNMILHDPELRKQLNISVDNMDDWCVSREYGLGTRLPNDTKFLIDSLSDSTIYMAYYTVCHLLHTDIYGMEECVPSDQIDDKFWNAVFSFSFFFAVSFRTQGSQDKYAFMKCLGYSLF